MMKRDVRTMSIILMTIFSLPSGLWSGLSKAKFMLEIIIRHKIT